VKPPTKLKHPDLLEDGDDERGGFARAGLSLHDETATLQEWHDGALLDRGRFLQASFNLINQEGLCV
jgi:hypothetical protein